MYLVTLTSGDLYYVNMAGQIVGSAPAHFSGTSGGGGGKILTSDNSNQSINNEDDHSGGEHEYEPEGEHD
jgi:hypothetical protein